MSVLGRKRKRDLLRQKVQFGAVGLTVFLGIALFAASYDSFRNLEASYERTFIDFAFADLTVFGGDVARFAAEARRLPGVEAATTRAVVDLPVRVGEAKLVGRLVSQPPDGRPAVDRVRVLTGRPPTPQDPTSVLVERHMADHFGLEPGDRLEVLGERGWRGLDVGGVVASPEYIWPARSRQEILTSPENFGVLFGSETLTGQLFPEQPHNEALVLYQPAADREGLDRRLAALAGELGATSTQTREEQPSNAGLREDLRGFEELSVFFPILFLLASGMAVYVLLTRLVQAQRPQVGLLRAEGYARRSVLGHYLGFGAVLGFPAAVLGVAAGLALAVWITSLYTRVIAVPVRLVEFHPITPVAGIVMALLATLIAAAAPALAASRVPPAEAMRGTGPSAPARAGLVERALPALRRMPARWRAVLRGPGRNPRRSASMIVGVVLSLVLVLVSWGMIDTVQLLLDRQFRQIQLQDADVLLATPGEGLDRLAAVEGVAAVEPSVRLPVSIRFGGTPYQTELMAFERATQMHRFLVEGDEQIRLPADGLLLGTGLRDVLGLEAGATVRVVVPDSVLGGSAPRPGSASGSAATSTGIEATVRGFVDEPLGSLAYVDIDALGGLMGEEVPATSALVRYSSGADREAVRRRLASQPEAAAVQDSQALYETIQRYMGLFYAFVGLMLAFGAAMAFALIFASMTVNITERSREFASFLAGGARPAELARLVVAENLLVVLAGIVPGVVAGYLVSDAAMASFSSDLFSFDLQMRATTPILASAAIVLVALVSQWPALRSIARLDVATVVRQRSL